MFKLLSWNNLRTEFSSDYFAYPTCFFPLRFFFPLVLRVYQFLLIIKCPVNMPMKTIITSLGVTQPLSGLISPVVPQHVCHNPNDKNILLHNRVTSRQREWNKTRWTFPVNTTADVSAPPSIGKKHSFRRGCVNKGFKVKQEIKCIQKKYDFKLLQNVALV